VDRGKVAKERATARTDGNDNRATSERATLPCRAEHRGSGAGVLLVTAEDINRACAILRKWRTNAIAKKNERAVKDVEHVMKVLDSLYKE